MVGTTLGDVRRLPREVAIVVGLISGSQFVNHMYLVLLPPILTILSDEFEVSLALLGIALGVQALTNTVFQLPFGYLADHYDRTIALAVSSFLGAIGVLVVAISPSFGWLVVGQAIIGIGVAGHHPAHYPLLTDATPDSIRGRAFSVYNFGGMLGFAAPPVIITAIITFPDLTWRHAIGTVGIVGIVYAVVVTAVFARSLGREITGPNVTDTDQADGILDRVRAELRSLVADSEILIVAVLALVAATANWALSSYTVVFLTETYEIPLEQANLTLTGLFLTGSVGVLASGSLTDRFSPAPVMLVSFVGLTVLVGVIASSLAPAIVAIGLFLAVGAVRSLEGPARDTLTERLSGDGTVGKSFAVVTIGIMLGSTIAPPVFGYLIDQFGVQAAFFAVGAVAAIATAVTVMIALRIDAISDLEPIPLD
ncbi:MFS transporter [Haloarcula marina]|uniref:MFS transporter n=1 Tax=Haloarcula marina TaxID=2961574 RepID=UPI0020B8B24D|nr:MFS transporter [Halomicroarcula marina]